MSSHRAAGLTDDIADLRGGQVQVSLSQSKLSIPELRSAIKGRVIAPDDPEYDAARQVFVGDIDRHPAVIVQVANTDDLREVIHVARETGLDLAVRCGGHGAGGFAVAEGGIVLDVRDLRSLEIDPKAKTAWAGAGLTAGDYTKAAGEHGLATGFGDTGSVGLSGLTLGGGVGYLVRKYGLTIDNLIAAEIVTADGEVLRVDANNHPDLFWAIRGGGGNFGVVTRFQLRLHEVGTVVGGMLMLPATPDVIAGFIAEAERAPEELSTIANIMPAPSMPFVPADVQGQVVIFGILCYAGDVADGERAVAPFRALATPIADLVKPMPYPEIYPPEDESYRPKAIARTMFVDRVDLGVAETIVRFLNASDASLRAAQLRVLGGAMARVPVDATAFAHRKSRIMVNVAAFYEGPDRAERERWVVEFADALRQDDRGAYVNFVGDEGPERTRAAYPGKTWDRLRAIKARYDPTNLFRLNQNIPPATVRS
jgi:FAD/FMN-containing dehydrogenase